MISFQQSLAMTNHADSIPTSIRFTRDWQEELRASIRPEDDILIVCTKGIESRGTLALAKRSLGLARKVSHLFALEMPDLHSLAENWDDVNALQPNTLVAIGGGSAIDSAKAVELMLSCRSKEDFTKQVLVGKTKSSKKMKLIAIPTTAGSGSEVTSFATIWDRQEMVKRSIEGVSLVPDAAILDPSLLGTLNGEKLLFPALDAVSHSLESLWNTNRTKESTHFAHEGLRNADVALESYIQGVPDLDSFVQSSVHAGLAIAITRTAIAHSISYPLTLRCDVPHGLACSFALPVIFDIARPVLALEKSDLKVIESVLSRIESLDLPRLLRNYCTNTEVLILLDQMTSLGRSNNFLFSISQNQLEQIVNASI